MTARSDGPTRWLCVGMAAAALIAVFAGFAHSFYLRPASMPALASGNIALHRRLGVAGAGLALRILVLGPVIALSAARRGDLLGDPLAFLLVILADLVLFAGLVAPAVYHRHRSETHKRLMLLAMVSILPPAISRWPIAAGRPPVVAVVMVIFLAAAPAYDLVQRRRPNPVSLWGGVLLFLSFPLRFAISQTEAWHRVARWLIA